MHRTALSIDLLSQLLALRCTLAPQAAYSAIPTPDPFFLSNTTEENVRGETKFQLKEFHLKKGPDIVQETISQCTGIGGSKPGLLQLHMVTPKEKHHLHKRFKTPELYIPCPDLRRTSVVSPASLVEHHSLRHALLSGALIGQLHPTNESHV